jgi:hypothetical protein
VRVPLYLTPLHPVPPALAGWASLLDLSGLSDELALDARRLLGRSSELSPQAQQAIGGAIVARVQAAVTPAPPPGVPGWLYLSTVLAERRRRAQIRYGIPDWGGQVPQQAPAPGYAPPGYTFGLPSGGSLTYGAPAYGSPSYGQPPSYGSTGYPPAPGYGYDGAGGGYATPPLGSATPPPSGFARPPA